MKHRFNAARVHLGQSGLWLCLRVENRAAARRFVMERKDKPYDAEFTLHREKRSLDANAYFWVLCGKLAAALGVRKSEIYRELIREIGENFEILPIRKDAAGRFIAAWERNGEGWVCDRLGPSRLPGYENVKAYYGSSVYDTAQMGRLIDLTVQECREQGIETMTPEELARLKEAWHEPEKQGA